MWIRKKDLNRILSNIELDVDRTNKRVNNLSEIFDKRPEETVACDKCKCRINKSDAVKGNSIIMKRYDSLQVQQKIHGYPESEIGEPNEEYIYTPYYCHRCKPKQTK